jgi:hypothetical protein
METQRVRRDTKSIGDFSELSVIYALAQNGYLVSVPFGENHRYDVIADDGERLLRVQIKTGRVRAGALEFNCYSSHSHRGGPSCRGYSGEIDAFGVYAPAINAAFLVRVSEIDQRMRCYLRLEPPKNNQVKKLRWARDFLLPVGDRGRDSARPWSTESRLEVPL